MKFLFGLVVFSFTLSAAAVAPPLGCINWGEKDPHFFEPAGNVNNQISPDVGLYWLKYDPDTDSEEYHRAYTPNDYLPYFSNGQANTAPNPADDQGVARAIYNETQLKGFYDPKKPTIILFHGWQPDSTSLKHRIDLCYRYPNGTNSYSKTYNTLQYWKDWNVAVFYWNQFADESHDKDVEAKLYSSTINQHMRWTYLIPGDPNTHYCTVEDSHCFMPLDSKGHVKTIADLAYEAVINAIPAVSPNTEFRITGQSFGAQLAILVTDRLLKTTTGSVKPTRLVLLDPYFTRGALENQPDSETVVNQINQIVTDIESQGLPISEYRTSQLSDFPLGDQNLWLMNHVAYERLYPKYLSGISGVDLLAEEHRAAIYLYFQSRRALPYWSQTNWQDWGHSYINAQATDAQLKALTHFKRVQVETPDHLSEYDFEHTESDAFVPAL